MNFKQFITESEEYKKDIPKTLAKIPKSHRSLLAGYKFAFQADNALKGDNDHIGIVDEEEKTITISAPWNYARGFTFLHEVAHLVWKYKMNPKLKKEWGTIVKKTKDKQDQGNEELFCMAYADCYSDHKDLIHHHTTWENFIKNIPK